uniref:Glycosyltransferase family 92 protein n=1 Tax=Crocodylus porosus TaxID=8502 RepID=A0A7M4EYM7_CROPO
MLYCGKKSCYVAVPAVFMFVILLTCYWKRSMFQNDTPGIAYSEPVPTDQMLELCGGKPASNTITALEDNRTFIVAPYFDNRESKITRVIAIVHHEEVTALYCWFCSDLLCAEPPTCEPSYVSIHSFPNGNIEQLPRFEIKNRKAESFSADFTVCISTMFGNYNNVLQFIQSVEMYKILGAQRVMIYKNSCSPLMESVLAFYIAEGTVEVVPWPITSHLKVSPHWRFPKDGTHIGYYGQITALNDCVYRNMYRSRFVLLNDIDEIILPAKHLDWKTMMRSLQEQNPDTGVFLFENHIFPNAVFTATSTGKIDTSLWGAVPGVNILQHIYRKANRKDRFNPRKMIVDPRKVIQTSVHSVLKMYGSSLAVSSDIAITFHCRDPYESDVPKVNLIRDATLWRYNESLLTNVNKVLHKSVLGPPE